MCSMVCHGQIDMATAQEAFAADWIAAYQAYYEGGKQQPQKPAP
jgi:general stress protein 26